MAKDNLAFNEAEASAAVGDDAISGQPDLLGTVAVPARAASSRRPTMLSPASSRINT